MNFVKKIFEDKIDESVHKQFVRLGKGEYERAFSKLKKSKRLSIKASYEFCNDLVELVAENAEGEIEISGVIITNKDINLDIEHEKKKRGKLYTFIIKKTTISKTRLREIYSKFKDDSLLLNLKSSNCELKCKNSLPKPGSKLKDNFCSANFNNLEVAREFSFDIPDFTNLEIKHIYKIEELIPGNEKNYEQMRINAKRKGKILRILDIDGKHEEKQKDFVA